MSGAQWTSLLPASPKIQWGIKSRVPNRGPELRVIISHPFWKGVVYAESKGESELSPWCSVRFPRFQIFPPPLGRGAACFVRSLSKGNSHCVEYCSRRVTQSFIKHVGVLCVLGIVPDAGDAEIQVTIVKTVLSSMERGSKTGGLHFKEGIQGENPCWGACHVQSCA